MANLLKIQNKKKEMEKLPSFPKIVKEEAFSKKFFKMVKYLTKTNDFKNFDFVKALSDITSDKIDETFKISSFEEANEEVKYSVRQICSHRLKVSDFSDVRVIYSDFHDKSYALLPSIPPSKDGLTYYMRHRMTGASKSDQIHITVQLMSIGSVFLAALLENEEVEWEYRKTIYKIKEGTKIFDRIPKIWNYWNTNKYEKALDRVIRSEFSYSLNHKYSREAKGTIATFRSDKKYQDQELNNSTIFNQLGFRKVEIDTQKYDGQEFDSNLFKQVENDFEFLYAKLPKVKAHAYLKFRKLGKHKAKGLYCPSLNILAVDVRYTESFIHEYGHYLDFKYTDTVLSESDDFSVIVEQYTEQLDEFNKTVQIKPSMLNYFKTPTEIFARGFELWVQANFVSESSVIKSSEIYKKEVEYKSFTDLELLFNYYDTVFGKHVDALSADKGE